MTMYVTFSQRSSKWHLDRRKEAVCTAYKNLHHTLIRQCSTGQESKVGLNEAYNKCEQIQTLYQSMYALDKYMQVMYVYMYGAD